MFILGDLLAPLQEEFSNTKQGQKRKVWFAYTLLAMVVPFTSSITSNLLRAMQTLFGLDDPEPAILCLYGEYDTALESFMENHVATDSRGCYRGAHYCCTG